MYLLGIDVGTTNTKAVVIDTDSGGVVAVGRSPTITLHPRPGWSEHSADGIWDAVVLAVRQAVTQVDRPEQIRAVSVASMGEASFPVAGTGAVLGSAISWHDARTATQAEWWRATIGEEKIFDTTGQIVHAMYSINKLMWFREHEPGLAGDIRHWMAVEDFVLWRLSGVIATDRTMASRTMVFDQRGGDWSADLLDHARVPKEWLPPIYSSGTPVGSLRHESASLLGLDRHVLVVVGGHDHLCGALAAGLVRPGVVLNSAGTADAIVVLTDRFDPTPDKLAAGFCTYAYVLPDTFVTFGSLNFTGGALEWLASLFFTDPDGTVARDAFSRLRDAAASVCGADGVEVLPYFLGTGTPLGHRQASAAISGLTPSVARPQIARALFESLGSWLRDNIAALAALGIISPGPAILLTGGPNQDPFLAQLKADVTGSIVFVPDVSEAAATGAALLAGIGCGAYRDGLEAAAGLRRRQRVYQPGSLALRIDPEAQGPDGPVPTVAGW